MKWPKFCVVMSFYHLILSIKVYYATSFNSSHEDNLDLSKIYQHTHLIDYSIPFTVKSSYLQKSKTKQLSGDILIDELQSQASRTHPLFIKCLKDSPFATTMNLNSLSTLPADIIEHYQDLLKQTERYYGGLPHSYAGYYGPWIENFFIYSFLRKPLNYFSGLVPLFIRWTDIHVEDYREKNRKRENYISVYDNLLPQLLRILRDDVIYVTVVQDDEGISSQLMQLKPNILVISAGGFGHIPIPLIKGTRQLRTRSFNRLLLSIATVCRGACTCYSPYEVHL